MNYFHAFWTRPQFRSTEEQETKEIALWDFEALTWLCSALEIGRHSPIRLITDSRGLKFVQRTGLDWIYNGGISTVLDSVPDQINRTIFWAAGKIYACQAVDSPCVGLDPDAILWQPLAPAAPVMALHQEDKTWSVYAVQREKYGWCGFDSDAWDWELEPFNLGVVYFESDALARSYAQTAIRFMTEFSAEAQREKFWGRSEADDFCDAMLFAEQRLLPMCMKRLGVKVEPIGRLQPNAPHLEHNPICCHLWTSKGSYRVCPEARLLYVNFLIDHLLGHYPEAQPTLAQWKLDGPRTFDSLNPRPDSDAPPADESAQELCLLGEIEGVVWLQDANLAVWRRASKGSLILPGETLRVEPGTTYELIVPGQAPRKFRQPQ